MILTFPQRNVLYLLEDFSAGGSNEE